jgi:hypothetical protein
VSFPVEHEKVDRRDLALACEFAARLVSFLSKDAASDAFAPSVISNDVEGCALLSSILASTPNRAQPQHARENHLYSQTEL